MNGVMISAETRRVVQRTVTCGNCGTPDTMVLRSALTSNDFCRTCLDLLPDRRRSWEARRGSIYKPGEFPVHCRNCGTVYNEQEWSSLFYRGVTPGTVPGRGRLADDIEVRDCPCLSTLSVALVSPEGAVR